MEEGYRTSDMGLVTYLKLKGFSPGRPNWVAGTCFWSFQVSPDLNEHVALFSAKSAVVEPTEFNRVFGETKREFYDTRPTTASA